MAYKIFISYSTKDLPIVKKIKGKLENQAIEIFIAEYSVNPGDHLNKSIINAINTCDLFLLLWSQNSKHSEYVPQEIGIAFGQNKFILPIVLESEINLPAFIQDLKYLPVYNSPAESLLLLQNQIFSKAEKQGQRNFLAFLGFIALLIWLLNDK